MQCPKCNSVDIRTRELHGFWEKLKVLFGGKRWHRCNDCNEGFWAKDE
jgi:hypothetical protein